MKTGSVSLENGTRGLEAFFTDDRHKGLGRILRYSFHSFTSEVLEDRAISSPEVTKLALTNLKFFDEIAYTFGGAGDDNELNFVGSFLQNT